MDIPWQLFKLKILIITLTLVTLMACNGNDQDIVSQKDQIELVSDSAKGLRKEFDQQQKDSLKNNEVYEKYMGENLKPIRTNFKKINEITEWTSIFSINLNQSTEGDIATYYFFQDTLLKVAAIYFGETGKKTQEFYTKDGDLSFVLEQQYQYNRPIYWDSVAMIENNDTETFDVDKSEIIEDRSYFENGILIRQINNQDCGAPFAEDYLHEEQIRLITEFGKLKRRLESKKKGTK